MKFTLKVVQEFQLLKEGVRPADIHKVDRSTRFMCKVLLPFPPINDTVIRREGCTFDIGPFTTITWDEEKGYFFCKQRLRVWNYDEGTRFIRAVENYSSEKGWIEIEE